ncbi:sensor histidine kinase [Amycolatopsis saalfeldensis]|uniref:Signal transduction histidine-protein kinase/phosphatase MprB n=1 Tax=Amycolatopsis saalfeldensis TaxID=394193 RepID=A0A1H8YG10_9PSEU|nr:HAMP domain-containing sensor histidine kinase [Amycolatopsis saalfeldensis]SEP50388.1 two-component system, OmpR family, sensor histidine kinase MtrB [Amycolatopsis saalfeldensis]
MRRPAFGLRARVTAAVVLVTTTATAVMALAAARLQDEDVLGGFTFAAQSSFGNVFTRALPGFQRVAAGTDGTANVDRLIDDYSQEWMIFTKDPQGAPQLVTYASTGSLHLPKPAPVRVNDRPAVVDAVADQVLVRTDTPSDLRTATTTDPDSGLRLLVVSGNYGDYWMLEFFDITPLEVGLAEQPQRLVYVAIAVALLGVVAALFAAWHIQRPIRRVASAARQLGDGAFDVRVPVKGRDELADLAMSFNTMAQRVSTSIEDLREKDGQQQRFVADVAHDLRTPLASIVATVDSLDSASPDTRARATRLLGTQARRLAKLVEDLMEISRFDAGSTDFRTEPVELPALVEDAAEVNVPDTAVQVTSTGDTAVVADPRRVHTIVGNLLVNAVRHGRAPVSVAVDGTSDPVTIEVRDSGPGIPEDLLPILFDRFVRGDHARQATEGSGLGLSIARENARLHGGEITARNDGGAVLTLGIPRRAADPPA